MKTADKIFVPPIKIQGIKTKIVPYIKANTVLNRDTLWVEPFMGSGVVGFNIAGDRAVFSDINPVIIDFYNQVKDHKITSSIAREYLEYEGSLLEKNDDKQYYAVRERFNKERQPLDFLFLNRSCFNGMIRFNKAGDFNVPYGHKPNRFAKAYVTKIVNQVKHLERKLYCCDWNFICQGFEKTLSQQYDNAFIYCDPPYIGRHVDYYDSWNETQERELAALLMKQSCRFMVSTWDFNKYRKNDYVTTLWSPCNKINIQHFYFVGAKEANRNPMTEALLVNF